jgi:D-alanyl-D-alanine carboxypeptidase
MTRSSQLRIRPALRADAAALTVLLEAQKGVAAKQLDRWLERGCVLLGETRDKAVGMAALELDQAALGALVVAMDERGKGLGRRLLAASEQLAVRFGLLQLAANPAPGSQEFFAACGYAAAPVAGKAKTPHLLTRHFPRRQTRYGARIAALQDELGIPGDYGLRRYLPLQQESPALMCIGPDLLGRNQHLTPAAARAWQAMLKAAMADGVALQAVSAFRSVDYQASIIRRKQQHGLSIQAILAVSAAPGFSEHHSGRAIDISTPGCIPLTEEFETTQAYHWLQARAAGFGFRLSYPRNNCHGIAYEPWHWCYQPR